MLMYIGGMQIDAAARRYAPSRIDEPPGTMRTPASSAGLLQRHRVLVVERPGRVGRHVDDVAEAEAEQDALLHPGVDAPAGRRRRHRARPRARRRRRAPRCSSAKRRARRRLVGGRALRRTALDASLQVIDAPRLRRRPAGRARCSIAEHLAPATPAAAAPSAAGTTSSHRPIAAIANFTGPDSTRRS